MASIEEKEWTLMFYLASDQPLAPEIVSQLKSIKQAGFHQDVNIVAQFDPNPVGAQTHIFDVNRINKIQARVKKELARGNNGKQTLSENKIGFIGFRPNDPFVVNLMTDKLWRDDEQEAPIRGMVIDYLKRSLDKKKGSIEIADLSAVKDSDFDPPVPPPFKKSRASDDADSTEALGDAQAESADGIELTPEESLDYFLKFCSENYPARHYILFILGHGIVVGNDSFLFDENAPVHSLTLQKLRILLETFKARIKIRDDKETGAQLELISFHSCSLSSVEVACELKDIAKYMLASQSPSFVGSWPYRQILIRMFNYLDRKEDDVKGLLTNFFHYCLYNGNDFLVAGYSCDLCLCDLTKVQTLEGPISTLSVKLREALTRQDKSVRIVRESVLLAHLDAQSYFNENYTDIFDFCFRLKKRLNDASRKPLPAKIKEITEACTNVMKVLRRGDKDKDNGLIIRSDFVGPLYQYSHGLSIYFPWSKPLKSEFWPEEYNKYQFIERARKVAKESSWSDFLATYFEQTRRATRMAEFGETRAPGSEIEAKRLGFKETLLGAFVTGMFNGEGRLTKPGPDSTQGADCDCQSIKNYPPFTRDPQLRRTSAGKIPVTPNALEDPSFTPDQQGPSFALDGLGE